MGLSEGRQFIRIDQLTRVNEAILAVPYTPSIYLLAARKPMDRYFYYLPWDADYARAPVLGQTHDICADLPKNLPALIHYNHWSVAPNMELETYAPCFTSILADHYLRQSASGF